eukprot:TRINITY_DN23581_c0_g1_i1.p1 TRINITY_DN23581_c0_g1~~TRINITY_DN23581_c0_g1_i1.p1  ORF type:complete len:599 (+),score=97.22 TRINITY_DN23581_c0_g1_i1:90-1886(+)
MILYETGSLHVSFAFRCSGSVIYKGLIWGLPSTLLALLIHIFRDPNGSESIGVSQAWVSYNFVVGFLVVFRTQQAYSRFWSGATTIQQTRGEWFNACSSLFAFSSNKPEKQQEVRKFHQLIVRLFSMLWCTGLEQLAGAEFDFQVLDTTGLDPVALDYIRSQPNRCEVILQWIQRSINNAVDAGILTVAPPILSRVYQELSRGIVNLNQVQTIIDIIFPFPYAQLVTFSLVIHSVLMPFIAAATVPELSWALITTFISVTALWCINYTAGELENPFGNDANDLPIAEAQHDLNVSLVRLLEPVVHSAPSFEWTPDEEDDGQPVRLQSWNDAVVSAVNRATQIRNSENKDQHKKKIFKARSKYFDMAKTPSLVPGRMFSMHSRLSRQSEQSTPSRRPTGQSRQSERSSQSGHESSLVNSTKSQVSIRPGADVKLTEPIAEEVVENAKGPAHEEKLHSEPEIEESPVQQKNSYIIQLHPPESSEATCEVPGEQKKQQARRKQQRQVCPNGILKQHSVTSKDTSGICVELQEPSPSKQLPQPPSIALPPRVLACSTCNHNLSEHAVFCANCGAKSGNLQATVNASTLGRMQSFPEPPLAPE